MTHFLKTSFALTLSLCVSTHTLSQQVIEAEQANSFAPTPELNQAGPDSTIAPPSDAPAIAVPPKPVVSDLYLAVAKNNFYRVLALCEHTCNLEENFYEGNNILHLAAKYGNFELFKFALERNTSYKANNQGETPLHWAAYSGNIQIMNYILQRQTDIKKQVNDKTKEGQTALFYVFKNPTARVDSAIFLLTQGSDCQARDREENTAMHLAMTNRLHHSSIEKLMQLGCNFNLPNKSQISALDLAKKYAANVSTYINIENLQIPEPVAESNSSASLLRQSNNGLNIRTSERK